MNAVSSSEKVQILRVLFKYFVFIVGNFPQGHF